VRQEIRVRPRNGLHDQEGIFSFFFYCKKTKGIYGTRVSEWRAPCDRRSGSGRERGVTIRCKEKKEKQSKLYFCMMLCICV
jgi:hypothetical protein